MPSSTRMNAIREGVLAVFGFNCWIVYVVILVCRVGLDAVLHLLLFYSSLHSS